jgi:hypothetical protein
VSETVDALAEAWPAAPRPAGAWHPWTDLLDRLDADVRTAVAGEDELVRRELDRLLELDAAPPHDPGMDGPAEAQRLLAGLPRPEGRHPYLDEIVAGLDAAALLLGALTVSPAARRELARRRSRPTSVPAGS